jgi:hypothetical protein
LSISPLTAPTKVKLINKIEKVKEMIMQKDQQMQNWKNKLISLNQIMILMHEAMTKTLGVSYELPQLDDSSICILIFKIKRQPKPLLIILFVCVARFNNSRP